MIAFITIYRILRPYLPALAALFRRLMLGLCLCLFAIPALATDPTPTPAPIVPPRILSQNGYATAAGDLITFTVDYGSAKSLSKMTFIKADGVTVSNILANTVNLKVSGDQIVLKTTSIALNGSNWRLVFMYPSGETVEVPFYLRSPLIRFQGQDVITTGALFVAFSEVVALVPVTLGALALYIGIRKGIAWLRGILYVS